MTRYVVRDLVASGTLRVEDGNHGNDRPRPGEFIDDGVAFIRAADMTSGIVDFLGAGKINNVARTRIRKGVGMPGDVILSHKGTVGRVAVVPTNSPEFVCSPQTTFWRSLNHCALDQGYLAYVLRSFDFQAQLAVLGGQTDMAPYVSLTDQRSMSIDVPPVEQQRAIADVLGALDGKIAANDRIARASLELARLAFQHEVHAGASEHVTLTDLCARRWLQLSDGYRTKRSEHGRPGLRILRAGDVGTDSITPLGADFVSDEFRASVGTKASQPGDVVLTTKGTVGRVAVVPTGMEQVVYSPQLCYFRVLDPTGLSPGFLSGWFRSDDLQRQAEARMFKSDMAPYINLQDIQSMIIPLVQPADQHRIGETQSALERVAHAVQHENSILAGTRDELLALLMSGKVRVRDAEQLAAERV